MNEPTERALPRRPRSVSAIAIINGIAFVSTLLFWGTVYVKNLVPLPDSLTDAAERANAATTYGFLIGDMLWSAPLLFLATIGLWRRQFWGWTAAQMVNALWVYSMTIIWMRDSYSAVSPGALLFTPFTAVAIWATYYLWKHRDLFSIAGQSR